MAITVDGVPVSGSTGHTTFSRNRYGAYTRRRVKPVNPTSPLQVTMRASFRAAIDAWTNDLTNAQRLGWTNWAAATPWLNAAGQSVHLAPQVAFTRVYQWCTYNAVTPVLTAPVINDTGSIDVAITNYQVGSPDTIVGSAPLITNSWQVTGGKLAVYVSLGANPSTFFPPKRFALFGYVLVGVTPSASLSITPAGSLPFAISVGQKVWFKVSAWHPDNRLTTTNLTNPVIAEEA